MIELKSEALGKSIEVDRVIGHLDGDSDGPTMIFTAGIHGNEPSGVYALHQVMEDLRLKATPIHGQVYALSGNLWALQRGERFHKQDLNRMWTSERMEVLDSSPNENEDMQEQRELNACIEQIMSSSKGPFYFIDLHTTSSETVPFLTVNDSPLNRKFTEQFPVPIILGIEEYLDGPLLSLINERGFVAFGYEAGSHNNVESYENHMAFAYLSMHQAGIIEKKDFDVKPYYNQLSSRTTHLKDIFEIYYRYEISKEEKFVMTPGFLNFQDIKKGTVLANSNGADVVADHASRLFMPLYQNQGNDGFFAVRKIPKSFLLVSAFCRKHRIDKLLPLLPGISWKSKDKDVLRVNKRVARVFAKQLFHLMGYRSKTWNKEYLEVRNREAAARYNEYQNEAWFRAAFE